MAKQTKKSEKAKPKQNVFLFHGDDDYSVRKKVEQWKAIFLQKHSAQGILEIDAEKSENPGLELLGLLESVGLFAATRLVIVSNLLSAPASKHEKVAELLENVPMETFLVLAEKQPVKKSLKLFKKFDSLEKVGKAKIQEFTVPAGAALDSFVAEYVKSRGGSISAAAGDRLAVLLGRDQAERVKTPFGYGQRQVYNLWQVTSELNKLVAFVGSRKIEVKDVESLVNPRIADNVFTFTDALGSRDQKRSLELLSNLLDIRGKPASEIQNSAILIIGAIAYQFRGLLQYKEAVDISDGSPVGQMLAWNPYRLRMVARSAQAFTKRELALAVKRLARIDSQLKSTNLPAQVLLTRFVNVTISN